MADKLTVEEKKAIAAFPDDKVQRIPRGESGIPLFGFSMRELMRISAGCARRNHKHTRSQKTDEEITDLWKKGLTDEEISLKVKLKPKSVWMRRYRMDLGIRSRP